MKLHITAPQTAELDGIYLHVTYNSAFWLGSANTAYDLAFPADREKLGLGFVPTHYSIDGDLTFLPLHGRATVEEDMEDWGESGLPVALRAVFIDPQGVTLTHPDGRTERLDFVEDLLPYNGCFYGDFEVFPRVED